MLGTVLLFVLLTPGVVGTLSLGFKNKLAPVIIHAVIFAFLLANYRSIPLLNMLEPFQQQTAGGITSTVGTGGTGGATAPANTVSTARRPANSSCVNNADCQSNNCKRNKRCA